MKPLTKIIIAFMGLGLGLLVFQKPTTAETNLPFPKAATCTGENGADCCKQAYTDGMHLIDQEWDKTLIALKAQPKPSSEKVDEAFESMRTARCLMQYLCKAVRFSTTAPEDYQTRYSLTPNELEKIPGCQSVDRIGLPSRWADAWDTVVNPVIGYRPGAQAPASRPGFTFIPQCRAKKEKDANFYAVANANYQNCLNDVGEIFASPDPDAPESQNREDFQNQSKGFIKMERMLKEDNADAKTSILEKKLSDIIQKTQSMEGHANLMASFIYKMDSLLECYAKKCD